MDRVWAKGGQGEGGEGGDDARGLDKAAFRGVLAAMDTTFGDDDLCAGGSFDSLFDHIDLDKDGRIQYEEFKQWYVSTEAEALSDTQ